jgi:hypothetical protein
VPPQPAAPDAPESEMENGKAMREPRELEVEMEQP